MTDPADARKALTFQGSSYFREMGLLAMGLYLFLYLLFVIGILSGIVLFRKNRVPRSDGAGRRGGG